MKAIRVLAQFGVKVILLRCAGFNNVDLEAAARNNIAVMRVVRGSDPLSVRAEGSFRVCGCVYCVAASAYSQWWCVRACGAVHVERVSE